MIGLLTYHYVYYLLEQGWPLMVVQGRIYCQIEDLLWYPKWHIVFVLWCRLTAQIESLDQRCEELQRSVDEMAVAAESVRRRQRRSITTPDTPQPPVTPLPSALPSMAPVPGVVDEDEVPMDPLVTHSVISFIPFFWLPVHYNIMSKIYIC